MPGVPGRRRALLLLVAGAGMLGWATVRYWPLARRFAEVWQGSGPGGFAITFFTGSALLVLGIHGLVRSRDRA